jgi:hypothetical protein
VLQRGEALQEGDASVCNPFAVGQVEVLQRSEAPQAGDAAVCHTFAVTSQLVGLFNPW